MIRWNPVKLGDGSNVVAGSAVPIAALEAMLTMRP